MPQMSSKTPQSETARSRQSTFAGSEGTALSPPPYGIDFVDRQAERKNNTGLPDHLKAGIENLSGMAMDDVKVHYNSSKPAQLQALAYTQGTEILMGPGQERHLPHEAWHVVQQKQGRVRPTLQAKGVAINDDHGLEREADVMGVKVTQMKQLYSMPATHILSKSPYLDVVQLKKPKITNYNAPKKKHPLSILNENFKNQLKDYPYPIHNGKQIKPSEFIKGTNKIEDEIARPESVEALVEGTRRTAGVRKAEPPQTEIGNIGEHERAMFNRPLTSGFTYAGGHLISDKILGEKSYETHNLAPQLADFNAPGWRVMEMMAEKGPYDTKNNKHDVNVPIDMKVEIKYADDTYTVDVADLVSWSIIPSTVTQTDSGGSGIVIPRRIPYQWIATLKIKDASLHPDHVLLESDIPPEPLKRFVGSPGKLLDPTANPDLTRQPSQAFIFGMETATQPASGKFRVGGKQSETYEGLQAYPQKVAQQPFAKGTPTIIKPSAPPIKPVFLKKQIPINSFFIPKEETDSSKQKKRKEAYDEIESVTDKVFRNNLETQIQYFKQPKERTDFGKLLQTQRIKKRKKDKEIVKKLSEDTNITGLT